MIARSLAIFLVIACTMGCGFFRSPPQPRRAVLNAPVTCTHGFIYGASWCHACELAAAHLRRRGVAVTERNLEDDEGALSEAQTKFAGFGRGKPIPLVDLCGTHLVGYSPDRIDDALLMPRP